VLGARVTRDGGARALSARNRHRCRRFTGVGARALRCRGSRRPVRRTAASRDGAARERDRPGANPQPRAIRRTGRRAAGRRPGGGGRRCRPARRRKSLHALGSVSERVAHRAGCSALVVRPPEPR
jgi:hypothetical protein